MKTTLALPKFAILWQPIAQARSLKFVAAEALARDELTGTVPNLRSRHNATACLAEAVRQTPDVNLLSLFASVNIECWMLPMLDSLVDSPAGLIFEITEARRIPRTKKFLAKLAELRERGYDLAVDDWPNGFSHANLLRLWKASMVKISMECFRANSVDCLLQEIALLHSFSFAVTIEGIESDQDLDKARNSGADFLQGFHPLLGRPVPIDELERILWSQPA